jgi:hypothetical protein
MTEIIIDTDLVSSIPVSPFLYGMNSAFTYQRDRNATRLEWEKAREAGVRLMRLCAGNNGTKYNWQKKISSHPDWYNNVYPDDWDTAARALEKELPGVSGMWCFQLLGKAASSSGYNFNDKGFNDERWWEGVEQNLAGYGVPDMRGGNRALREGDPSLYLMDWPVDSSVALLNHWFATPGLGLDKQIHQYWNLDNEPDIWNVTHDDVMREQLPAEQFMRIYFEAAKKARECFPAIKLVGPTAANEWQWYAWNGSAVDDGEKKYPWLEYFIKRVAEEQNATGLRLLDVLDIHFYPTTTLREELVQLHRVFFDRDYDYPGASGVKFANDDRDPGWAKEYIFGRCRQWLEKYMGADHGVGLGLSEVGIASDDPNAVAVWYASLMGEFMKQGVELLAPWTWKPGMWEVIHLFSRYNRERYLSCPGTEDNDIAVHPTVDTSGTAVTIVLINRNPHLVREVSIHMKCPQCPDTQVERLSIPHLPEKETFISRKNNALVRENIPVTNNKILVELAPMSVSAILVSTCLFR